MALKIRLHAPSDIRYRTINANGRTYVGVPGTTLDVLPGDAHLLLANGWTHAFACGTCPSGTTAERPARPGLGQKYHDTTLGALMNFDGVGWRNTVTGVLDGAGGGSGVGFGAKFPEFQAAWVAAQAATQRLLGVIEGDSTIFGRAFGGGTFSTDGAFQKTIAARVASRLVSKGVSSRNSGWLGHGNSNDATDYMAYNSEVVLGAFTNGTANSVGAGQFQNAASTGSPLIYTIPEVSNQIRFIYPKSTSFGAGQYSVDGGATQVAFSEVNATQILQIDPATFPTRQANNTFRFDRVSGGSVYISGCIADDTTQSYIQLLTAGSRQWTTADAVTVGSPWRSRLTLQQMAPKIRGICYGINDFRSGGGGLSTAAYEANLSTLYDDTINNGGWAFFIVPSPYSPGNESAILQSTWRQSIYNVATAKGVANRVFDIPALFGEWAAWNALSLTDPDGLHLLDGAGLLIANAMGDWLTS